MILAEELSLKQLQGRRNLNKNSGIDGFESRPSRYQRHYQLSHETTRWERGTA